MTGTVLSHLGTSMCIHDPGHAIASAWTQAGQPQASRAFTAIYELREGLRRAVIKSDELWVYLGPDGDGKFKDFLVIGTDEDVANAGRKYLVVEGDASGHTGSGKWYVIHGKPVEHEAQSGVWHSNATSPSQSGITIFNVDPKALLAPEMAGWYLQPVVNQQAPEQTRCVCSGTFAARTAPITQVDPALHTVRSGHGSTGGLRFLDGTGVQRSPGTRTRL